MVNDVSRRRVLTGVTATLALAASRPRRASALTTAEAEALVNRIAAEITAVINSGRSAQAMYGEFERIFTRYADVPTIAVSALGPPARSASRAQLAAFTEAFRGYIARKYGKRFREFVGGSIRVVSARPVKSFYEVRTITDLRGEAPFEVTYLISDRSGRDLFFDMLVEGISLLKAERQEIGAMLEARRGNIDQLVADLRRAG